MTEKALKSVISLQWLVRPALLLAIGFHTLLLLLPLPNSSKKPEAAKPEAANPKTEVETKITRLPTAALQRPLAPSPQPSTTAQASPLSAKPLSVKPVQRPSQLPIRPAAAPSAPKALSQKPAPLPLIQPSPVPNPAPIEPPPANLQIPFADFPDLAGVQTGCFSASSCRQVNDGTPFRNAAQTLEQQMNAQGYQVTERSDLEDTGQKVYQLVSKDGTTRYLNVLSADVGSTVYLLASEPITLSDLQQTATAHANLTDLLAQIGDSANAAQVPYPTLFLVGTKPRPEISQIRWVTGTTPDQLANTLTSTLQRHQFSIAAVGDYGGGRVYEVGQKAFTGYLNLVTTEAGTLMILWKALPT